MEPLRGHDMIHFIRLFSGGGSLAPGKAMFPVDRLLAPLALSKKPSGIDPGMVGVDYGPHRRHTAAGDVVTAAKVPGPRGNRQHGDLAGPTLQGGHRWRVGDDSSFDVALRHIRRLPSTCQR